MNNIYSAVKMGRLLQIFPPFFAVLSHFNVSDETNFSTECLGFNQDNLVPPPLMISFIKGKKLYEWVNIL